MTHVSKSALWIFNKREQEAPTSQPNGHNTTAGAQICQPYHNGVSPQWAIDLAFVHLIFLIRNRERQVQLSQLLKIQGLPTCTGPGTEDIFKRF